MPPRQSAVAADGNSALPPVAVSASTAVDEDRSITAMMEKVIEVYSELLGGRHSPRPQGASRNDGSACCGLIPY